MFITRVELRNIKNHAESSFTFQPGVIAICGPNGSGKTTILEAIAWVLFDHLDYKREDFIRRGEKKGQATVGFVSDLDNREYLVTRDTGGGYFVYDPSTKTRLVEQKTQVLPWLRLRLGVEAGADLSSLFRTTIGVPQGTFTFDFTLPASTRKSVFDRILRVEEYRQAADNLRQPQRLAESRAVEAERQLARYEGELTSYDELVEACRQTAERLAQQAVELATLLVERERLGGECEKLEANLRLLEQSGQGVEQFKLRFRAAEESSQLARLAAEQAEEAAAIVTVSREGFERYLEVTRRLEPLERRREERDRKRDELAGQERRLIEAEGQAGRVDERLREVARAQQDAEQLKPQALRQEEFEQQLARLREERGESQSLEGARQDLDQELEKLRTRYQEIAKQIDEAERRSVMSDSLESLEQKRTRLGEERQRMALCRETRQSKGRQLERIRLELERELADEARTSGEMARLEATAVDAARVAEFESRQNELTSGLARLRAETTRDREMIVALETGGLCPLLTEKCLNLSSGELPGESIQSRFHAILNRRQAEIISGEAELEIVASGLVASRLAATACARLPHLHQSLERITETCCSLQSQLDELVAELAELPQSPEIEEARLRQNLNDLEREIAVARESQRLIHQAEILRQEQARVQMEGVSRRAEHDRLVARIDELGDTDSRIAEAQRELRELNDPRSRMMALQQTIEREAAWLVEAQSTRSILAEARLAASRLRDELCAFDSLEHEIADVSRYRAATERDYLAYIANENQASTLIVRQEAASLLAAEVVQLQTALTSAELEFQSLDRGYDKSYHLQCRQDYDLRREQVTMLTAQRAHLEEQLRTLESRIVALDAIREELRTLTIERDKLRRLGGKAEMIRDILVRAAPFITESYIFSISHEANQLYREISGRYDVTLRWTRDYEIVLEENGHDRPFLNLSGGEQMAAALAVRLALLKELSDINIAFFDEPTTNMDEERRRNLALQLGRLRDFHQLFVISHDDSFEGFTDQQINLGDLRNQKQS